MLPPPPPLTPPRVGTPDPPEGADVRDRRRVSAAAADLMILLIIGVRGACLFSICRRRRDSIRAERRLSGPGRRFQPFTSIIQHICT